MTSSSECSPSADAASRVLASARDGIIASDPLRTPRRMFANSARLSVSKIGTTPTSSNSVAASSAVANSALRMKSVKTTQRSSGP